jgi:hypothetical protein
MGWKERSVEESGDLALANVPREFFRFYQVQPAVWNLEYLDRVCRYAGQTGAASAWDFEEMLPGPPGRHAVAGYAWPCTHHGFLERGRVNYEALRIMRHPATRPLASELKRRFALERGPFAYERLRLRRALHLDGFKNQAKRLLFG